jgi:hypothetical protein
MLKKFDIYSKIVFMGAGNFFRYQAELVLRSNGNDIETKAERSFDLDFVFDIEAKRTCLFQNL